jgi:phage terminase Nu1 subunit (DNA packaging protein)
MTTVAQCAAHLFLTERRFHQLLDAGVIARAGRGKYELDAVRRQYIEHIRSAAAGRGSDGDLDLTQERARLAAAQASLAEMKLAAERGRTLDADEVQRTWSGILREVRAGVLSLPSRIGGRLGLDRAGINLVRDEVYAVLTTLASNATAESAAAARAEESEQAGEAK